MCLHIISALCGILAACNLWPLCLTFVNVMSIELLGWGLRPAYLVRLACPVQFWYCLNIMVNLVQLNYPLWQGFFLSNFINCYGLRSLCMWFSMITLIIIQKIDKWYQLAPPLTCLWRKEWLLFLWELICADLETVLLFSFKSFLVDQLIYYWIFEFFFFFAFFQSFCSLNLLWTTNNSWFCIFIASLFLLYLFYFISYNCFMFFLAKLEGLISFLI